MLKANQTVACLETLHENSLNDSTSNFDRSYNFNQTPLSVTKRKRKLISPESASIVDVKRKRDKSFSEKRKKVSELFKTPINYFTNRRRTIDASTFNESLNESIASTSGLFNVETVHNLSCLNDSITTPSKNNRKLPKKSLFTRTFSSSKFVRSKSKKKVDLNATKLSFSEINDDGNEKLNASCFPDFSLHPATSHSELSRPSRRTSAAVLTSFHTVLQLYSASCYASFLNKSKISFSYWKLCV